MVCKIFQKVIILVRILIFTDTKRVGIASENHNW